MPQLCTADRVAVLLGAVKLTAISRHADIEMPVPSINFSAYSLPSLTDNKHTQTHTLSKYKP